MLEQPLQQKQITNRKRLILAGRRHVASRARESGKDFAWGAFAVPIEGGVERGGVDPWRSLARSVSHAHPSVRTLAGLGSSCCLHESSNYSWDLRRSLVR